MGHIEKTKTSPNSRKKYTRYVSQRNLALKRRRDREDVRKLEQRVFTLERLVRNMVLHKVGNLPQTDQTTTSRSELRRDLQVLDKIAKQYELDSNEGSKQD